MFIWIEISSERIDFVRITLKYLCEPCEHSPPGIWGKEKERKFEKRKKYGWNRISVWPSQFRFVCLCSTHRFSVLDLICVSLLSSFSHFSTARQCSQCNAFQTIFIIQHEFDEFFCVFFCVRTELNRTEHHQFVLNRSTLIRFGGFWFWIEIVGIQHITDYTAPQHKAFWINSIWIGVAEWGEMEESTWMQHFARIVMVAGSRPIH